MGQCLCLHVYVCVQESGQEWECTCESVVCAHVCNCFYQGSTRQDGPVLGVSATMVQDLSIPAGHGADIPNELGTRNT